MTPKLHPIKHDLKSTLWCGPAALSIVTGAATSEIHRLISWRSGKPRVKGISNHQLCMAARDLGYQLVPIYDAKEDPKCFELAPSTCAPGTMIKWPKKNSFPTLARFLRENKAAIRSAPVIVNVTRHYIVVHGRSFVDNQNRTPLPLKKAPGRRRRVWRAWKVVAL